MDGRIWILTALCWLGGKAENMRVHRVKAGETVVLPCFSNDDDHRFQYWEMGNDKIVGPWNKHNQNKYKYEVWSGKLIIQSVSTVESGFYKCISKEIKGAALNADGIELIVYKDWEESFEHDSETNAYRTIIGILILLMVLLIAGIFLIIKRRKSDALLDVTREETPEEATGGVEARTNHKPNERRLLGSGTRTRTDEDDMVETDMKSLFS